MSSTSRLLVVIRFTIPVLLLSLLLLLLVVLGLPGDGLLCATRAGSNLSCVAHFITNTDMSVWTLQERLNTRPALEPTVRHYVKWRPSDKIVLDQLLLL